MMTQRLTPTAGMDPMQRKIMQFMPIGFSFMFAFSRPAWCFTGQPMPVFHWHNSGTSPERLKQLIRRVRTPHRLPGHDWSGHAW
jgi:hypothetical protein